MLTARNSLCATVPLIALFLVLTICGSGPCAEIASPAAAGKTVVIIPVEGFIDGGLFDSIKRRVDEAMPLKPDLLIFRIDTYGGAVEFAMEITDYIGAIDSPKTVAYIPKKAYSAGAMIALAAREIVMSPMASIGDAAPVASAPTSPDQPQILGEKFQSPVRNVFRKYAERNGYPVVLAEAMVTPEIEVLEVSFAGGTKKYMSSADFDALTEADKARVAQKRVIDSNTTIVTLSAKDARDYGFVRFIAKDTNELLAAYELPAAELVTLEANWSEALVRFLNHPAVSGILLLVAIIAAYMEFKAPGMGLPGAVALVCFAAFFFSKYLSGMATYVEILIFILGMMLLAIELFLIPGFGIVGFSGVALMMLGLVLMLLPSRLTTAPMDIDFLVRSGAYTVAAILASFVAGIVLARYLPRAPILSAIYLGSPEPATVAHREGAGVTEGRNLVGKRGTAMTMLRPAGKAEIGAEILDVTTQGEIASKGVRIEVIAQKSNNIIVREVK